MAAIVGLTCFMFNRLKVFEERLKNRINGVGERLGNWTKRVEEA